MMVVALIGKKHCGKSHVAQLMKKHKSADGVLSFGEKMRETTRALFGWTEGQLHGDQKEVIDEEFGISPREWYKWFATDIMREQICEKFPAFKEKVGEGIWAYWVIRQLQYRLLSGEDKTYVIDDLRHVSDEKRLREWCAKNNVTFVLLRVEREGVAADNTHRSESEIDLMKPDGYIRNDPGTTDASLLESMTYSLSFGGN